VKTIRFPFILLLLIALVVADGVITEFVVGSGLATECNPLMKLSLGEGNFIPLKICGGVLSALVLWDINRKHQRVAWQTSLVFIAIYTAIVYWNFASIFVGRP
jgi:hypothetical protein